MDFRAFGETLSLYLHCILTEVVLNQSSEIVSCDFTYQAFQRRTLTIDVFYYPRDLPAAPGFWQQTSLPKSPFDSVRSLGVFKVGMYLLFLRRYALDWFPINEVIWWVRM